jgi:hypothetical protein
MKLTGKSTSLLSIAMLMAGISLTWSADKGTVESLPTMPAVSFASVTSFQITVGNSPRTTISRTGDDSWELTEPINGAADAQVVRSLLRHVNRGVEFDVKVDNENYDEYGLDNGERVLFEIFSSSEVPTHSMSIGSDTFGGASFVKLPNSETVYRGNVGSRMNYARTPADWRDKMVTHIGDSSISSMRIERANDTLSFENTDGFWSLDEAEFEIDQRSIVALAHNMGLMRAGEILSDGFNAEWENPSATVFLELSTGETIELVFGGLQQGGAAFVRRGETAYRIAGSKLASITRPLEAFRVLQILDASPIDLARITMSDSGVPRVLVRGEDSLWSVESPANIQGNLQEIAVGLSALLSLRADSIPPTGTPFGNTVVEFTLEYNNGDITTIELGQGALDSQGREVMLIREINSGNIFVVRFSSFERIFPAFGRG